MSSFHYDSTDYLPEFLELAKLGTIKIKYPSLNLQGC